MSSTLVPSTAALEIAVAIERAFGARSTPAAEPIARYVKIDLAARRTGYTPSAIRTKMDKGVWIEGREFIKAPDGERLVDMQGYEEWVRRGKV
jgi:hypothetical protein